MILSLIGFTRLVEMRKFVVIKPRYNSLGATIILLPLDIKNCYLTISSYTIIATKYDAELSIRSILNYG